MQRVLCGPETLNTAKLKKVSSTHGHSNLQTERKKSGQEADYSSYIDFLAEIYNSPKIQRKIHQKLERKKGRILNDLKAIRPLWEIPGLSAPPNAA